MLPVYDKPMVIHTLVTIINGGINDLLLVVGRQHSDWFYEMLGDGSKLNCCLTYLYEDTPIGPGAAFLLAEKFVNDEPCVLILGDGLFFVPLSFTDKMVSAVGAISNRRIGRNRVLILRVCDIKWLPVFLTDLCIFIFSEKYFMQTYIFCGIKFIKFFLGKFSCFYIYYRSSIAELIPNI